LNRQFFSSFGARANFVLKKPEKAVNLTSLNLDFLDDGRWWPESYKKTLSLLVVLFLITASMFGDDAIDYYNSGNAKIAKGDF
jgi:hypothetical protein